MSVTPGHAGNTQRASVSRSITALPVSFFCLHGSLGGGEARHRHAVWRATHIVQAEDVAEANRGRVSPMLAADPDLEIAAGFAALVDGDRHQAPHALGIQGFEGIDR